jgi:hypothetical protein
MPFALLNPDHHTLAVDVGDLQMQGLADAHTRAVHRAEDHSVREGWSRFKKTQDLLRAEDRRQPVFMPGSRDRFDNPVPFQSDGVQKPQGGRSHRLAAD